MGRSDAAAEYDQNDAGRPGALDGHVARRVVVAVSASSPGGIVPVHHAHRSCGGARRRGCARRPGRRLVAETLCPTWPCQTLWPGVTRLPVQIRRPGARHRRHANRQPPARPIADRRNVGHPGTRTAARTHPAERLQACDPSRRSLLHPRRPSRVEGCERTGGTVPLRCRRTPKQQSTASRPRRRHCGSGEQPAKVAGGVRFRPEQASRRLVSFGVHLGIRPSNLPGLWCMPSALTRARARRGRMFETSQEQVCPGRDFIDRRSFGVRSGPQEPSADTALQTRTWRRAGRLPSPVASCAFDLPCVRGCHRRAERDAVHLHLSTEQREARGLVAPLKTGGDARRSSGSRWWTLLLEHPSCCPTAAARAFADGAGAWLPRPRTARPDLSTNDTTAMRD